MAALKYKKGEGLVQGTECSVCLNEFEEDDDLRLLPKCNHAFHLPCIDNWLASYTNCPLCRASIVIDPGRTPPSLQDSNLVGSSSVEDTQTGINGGMEHGASEDGRGVCKGSDAEVGNVRGRRTMSVSLTAVGSVEFRDGDSKNMKRAKGSSSMKMSSSCDGKHMVSWYGRSQRKPSVPLRSF